MPRRVIKTVSSWQRRTLPRIALKMEDSLSAALGIQNIIIIIMNYISWYSLHDLMLLSRFKGSAEKVC